MRAILHTDGSGSVQQSDEVVARFTEEKADLLMQFLADLDYYRDRECLNQSATKFLFQNFSRDLSVYPQACALQAAHDAMLQSRHIDEWNKYNFDLAFAIPVAARTGHKAKNRQQYGSQAAAAVFKGGGPFMLHDSDHLTADVLTRLGYLDADLNTDLAEAMEAFINRPDNKHALRKLEMLPAPHDTVEDVDDTLRKALLSHGTRGLWQLPAKDFSVRRMLYEKSLLPSDKAPKLAVLKAMQAYARETGLPMRKTYNLSANRIMHHACKKPKTGWISFQTL